MTITRGRLFVRAVGYFCISVISCTVAAAAVGTVLHPWVPAIFGPSEKVTDAAADPKTNVLIFGTSRVEDGVIPNVFDTAMQQAGISGIRSYNIAEPGKLFIESFSDAEDFFSVENHDVKYVLFEPNVIGDLVGSAPNSVRSLRFFAPQGAYWAMRMMSKPALDVTRIPGSLYVAHVLGAVIRRYFGIGLAWVQPEISAGRFSKSSRGFPDIDVDESATSEPHALARAMT